MSFDFKYIYDGSGEKKAVQISIQSWEKLLNEYNQLKKKYYQENQLRKAFKHIEKPSSKNSLDIRDIFYGE